MKLYIVRHGESTGNFARIHQDSSTPLSDLGLRQAEYVAKRFQNIPIDLIIASPYKRAAQTAEIIGKVAHAPLEHLELLVEEKRPSEVIGKSYDHPEVIKINKIIHDNRHDPSFRYSDEETIFDMRDRCLSLLDHLLSLKQKDILLVTHERLLKTFLAILLFQEDFTSKVFVRMDHFLRTKNTGVTICELTENNRWRLHVFNDVSHLEVI